ncbi:dipeptide/oligopeptide/nickel ABC transporter ATP-binding protein [Kaistia dalseonensis]|uniref:Peptide/nickel transport system ATP-binding protein n=1 Tax=Kaistia dalseonensis TaxID=410840 RepID=A0ABU0H4W5_9HYPH|nr:dipeptide/oligopeptide/nickel ABC transporter ATP-binding protein [Kaistia dalseonensis]MCX5494744.1 dipeptide/oligopeptide/nickel ABC transporter ATP-binding protein [Kaistia dalseonensis]MDQ0437325.1 peptide/nickel transport system ATP-binding protein [Kaistia dalseonensis]
MTTHTNAPLPTNEAMRPILEMRQVTQTYTLARQKLFEARPTLTVLDHIDFDVRPGEAVGLVGESGSGKTTLTRILTGMEQPREGHVLFDGRDVWTAEPSHRQLFRRSVQVVMQNPRSSLDPRMRLGASLLEPLRSLRIEGDHAARVYQVLDQVGLSRNALERFPHEFSGGQLQRIAIARALMSGPKVLIADEPVSALDVSIQAQVLNLLKDLVRDLGLALVFIAHDLSVVAYTTSRVSVMSAGRIVEIGKPLDLFTHPKAEATRNLVGAILTVESGLAGNALA